VGVQQPETRYAKSGDVSIAYQVTGDGPYDVVYVPGFVSNVELAWTVPQQAALFERLASSCRLIRFDKRGTGMSDRVTGLPDLETRMDDVRAVMDAVGSPEAALIGLSEGGPMSILFAATYPDRCWALVVYSSFPRIRWAPDFPIGETEEELTREREADLRLWGDSESARALSRRIAPTADEATIEAMARNFRQSASPGAADALHRMNAQIDVRAALPAIRVPLLTIVRGEDDPINVMGTRYIAEKVPGARHVELPGADHALFAGDWEAALREIEPFLGDAWAAREEVEPDRVLATVLFTDIVGATATAAELGDRRWRELLTEHHAVVRRELARFRGRGLDTAGDGFFASFDGPAGAVRCACAISEGVRRLGIELRAGLHTGECEVVDGKVGGIAVHIGARVAAQAGPSEVLVSSTVRDLVAGSGLAFEERGATELKGVPGEWRLYAVAR